ncbi:hypothetical protein EV646_11542 [Kribbella antiqua]|uniref:Uncharacterized protein n=1 Tax=Kribbella antiqua TaxID=2512217 RepID=A0A4R2IAK3_9ACTN|nr:hypothetical protein EV646_11542 [Kribbella antiqua]
MATFNSPPGWPEPLEPDWEPPPDWLPDQSWPAAPPGWAFWLNSRGTRSRGPSGGYGAEPPLKLVAGCVAGGIAFIVLLTAISGGDNSGATFASVPGSTITTTVTVPGPTATITVTEPVGEPVDNRPCLWIGLGCLWTRQPIPMPMHVQSAW